MGENRRKKERRRENSKPHKPTEKLAPLTIPTDHAVAEKQRTFCLNVVDRILDDEASLSFSQPVNELWDMDQLGGYFEKIKHPMDLGTVKKHLQNPSDYLAESGLFDPNAFRKEVRLVFLNCLEFNSKSTDLYRLANKFLTFVDKEIADMPGLSVPEEPAPNGTAEHKTTSTKEEKQKETSRSEDTNENETAMSDEKKDPDEDVDMAEENDDVEDGKPEEHNEEIEAIKREIEALEKKRKQSEGILAELELIKNVPLTHEENIKLRDDVETLPWEDARKVVRILQKYVDEALGETEDNDPEFVTIEFSTVEPRLLREIEEVVRPNPKVEKEKKTIVQLNEEINSLNRKLKRKYGVIDTGSQKKKQRKRR